MKEYIPYLIKPTPRLRKASGFTREIGLFGDGFGCRVRSARRSEGAVANRHWPAACAIAPKGSGFTVQR